MVQEVSLVIESEVECREAVGSLETMKLLDV